MNSIQRTALAKRITELRENKGLPKNGIPGISPSSMQKFENENEIPGPASIKKFAKACAKFAGHADVIESELTKLAEEQREQSRRSKERPRDDISEVERHAGDSLYHFDGGFVSAIRVFGAGNQFIPTDRLIINYKSEPFEVPSDLKQSAEDYVQALIAKGLPFHNGPCVRLKNLTLLKEGADETTTAVLELRPIGWYHYEGLNGWFRSTFGLGCPLRVYEHYTALQRIIDAQDISHSRLSNIVDTVTTILTSDGFLGFIKRGKNPAIAMPGRFSAVCENINRFMDDSEPLNPLALVNPSYATLKHTEKRDNRYEPTKVPHPVAAVRRGLAEELSPDFLRMKQPLPKLLGISFDLLSAHPDLLFTCALPLSRKKLIQVCLENPGKDFHEGRLQIVPANLSHPETQHALRCREEWLPGGHASVVRTLQFIHAFEKHGMSYPEVFSMLLEV